MPLLRLSSSHSWRGGRWTLVLVMLPVAVAGSWLAAVDLDVRRLPDQVLLRCAGVVASWRRARQLI